MKCVLLLSLAALSCAVPITPDGPIVRLEKNDSISVTGYDGQKLLISKTIKNDGLNYIEISVTDLQGRTNTFRVDRDNNLRLVKVQDSAVGGLNVIDGTKKLESSLEESKKVRTESDILKELYQEFRRAVGLKAYENILRKIDSYIESGEIDSSIFEVLKSFAKYEALWPEGSYLGQATIVSKPNPINTYFPNYLNRAIDEQQRENDAKYGVRQAVSELSQGPIYYEMSPFLYRGVPMTSQKIVQWPQYGVKGESLQQYSDTYGQVQKQQVAPVQTPQQYPQQAWQPTSTPYRQVLQPLKQWNLPQSLWILPKQLAQEQQNLLWNQVQIPQQLTVPQRLPQEQQLKSQLVLAQPQEQLNSFGQQWLLPQRQLSQVLPWNQAQKLQQYYNPQQQLVDSKQQKELVQQQYLRPQQPYANYIAIGEQLPQSQQGYLWNQNQKQLLSLPQQQWIRSPISQPQVDSVYQQERQLGQQWGIPNQQLEQEQLGRPLGQQTQGNILPEYYWQSPLAAQSSY